MLFPSVILGINTDTSASAVAMIKKQLMIDFTFDQTDWIAAIMADSTYPNTLKRLNLRILVLIPSFADRGTDVNWNRYDIVAFVKNGLISIEETLFGPPVPQLSIEGLTWGKMGVFESRYH
jgi:hypothetical protein